MRFLIKLTVDLYQVGGPHRGVLIVPYSLPNHQPARIAQALGRWQEHRLELGEPGAYSLDFLPSQAD